MLNNREIALVAWLLVLVVAVLVYRGTRGSALAVLKTVASPQMLIPLLAIVAYISLVLAGAYKVGAWDFSLLKTTLFWFFAAALVMFFTANEATRNNGYFRKVVIRNLQLAVVLEFVVNLYVFNLVVELALVPVLAFIAMLGAYAETEPQYKPVRTLTTVVTTGFGLYLLGYAIVQIVRDFEGFATLRNLNDFMLPIILTLVLIPFLYVLALYMAYQLMFTRLRFLIKDRRLARFAKWQVFKTCRIRLSKVNRFASGLAAKLYAARDRAEVMQAMEDFKTHR
jgi:hypothetical protein